MRKQYKRLSRDQRNRCEIFGHIVRYRLIQPLRQNRARLHQQQRMSVGSCLGDQIGTDHGPGTRAIFHDDRLLQLVLQLPSQNPCCGNRPRRRRQPAPPTLLLGLDRFALLRSGERPTRRHRLRDVETGDVEVSWRPPVGSGSCEQPRPA